MLKRKCYEYLKQWKKESNGSTAVLLEGARRVGKTTLVCAFAKKEYEDFIYIDFSTVSKDVENLFYNQRDNIDTFLRMLQLFYGKNLPERHSVIIFDEVQRMPIAREYIKHLVKDGRFDYIETGSLISIKKNVKNIIIPSEEERIVLNPLDFEEYLWANDLEIYSNYIRENFKSRTSLPQAVHGKIMQIFNEYMLVGGMPQAVNAFLEKKNFILCNRVKKQILNLYIDDLTKFADNVSGKAKAIYAEVPGQLSSSSKRFKLGSIDRNARYENYEAALFFLQDSHLVNTCKNCNDPAVGYRLHANSRQFKCYLSDTGLLVTLAFEDGPESMRVYGDIQFGKLAINKGMLTENIVSQQLVASGHSLYYHSWKELSSLKEGKQSIREIDFLISKGYRDAAGKLRVCPIEVKSSKNYKTKSLDDFRNHWGDRTGYEFVLHPKNVTVEGNRFYLPLYMAFCL